MRGDHGESLQQRKQLELEDELCVGTALTVRGETAQGGEPWGTQHPKVAVGTSSTGHRVGGGSRVLEPGEDVFRVLALGHPALVCSPLQCLCPHILPEWYCLGSPVYLPSSALPLCSGILGFWLLPGVPKQDKQEKLALSWGHQFQLGFWALRRGLMGHPSGKRDSFRCGLQETIPHLLSESLPLQWQRQSGGAQPPPRTPSSRGTCGKLPAGHSL